MKISIFYLVTIRVTLLQITSKAALFEMNYSISSHIIRLFSISATIAMLIFIIRHGVVGRRRQSAQHESVHLFLIRANLLLIRAFRHLKILPRPDVHRRFDQQRMFAREYVMGHFTFAPKVSIHGVSLTVMYHRREGMGGVVGTSGERTYSIGGYLIYESPAFASHSRR